MRCDFRKCYYCLCQVCNMRKCPWRCQERSSLCVKSCISKGEYIPRLECDFFEHFRKTKKYTVKRYKKPLKAYTERSVSDLLTSILSKLGDDVADTGSYNLIYCDISVGIYPSYDLAKQAAQYYKDQTKVKILKVE